ncbi:MAG: DUF934 domain-containing protein [Betaproteobacteria bacterium]|nr:DUF934 domain-containing protein [Betaproteobacteria bacterium]
MAKQTNALIKHRDIVEDHWKVLNLAANDTPQTVKLPVGPLLVPLSVWRARKAELIRREWEQHELLGVWLAPEDDPAEIVVDLDDFSVVGVHFPLASDGRGYSIATLLRTRFGYRGELRAFGNIGRDHLHYLHRVGFDAFVVNQPELAIASLDDFSEAYQAAANQSLPLYRRRALGA